MITHSLDLIKKLSLLAMTVKTFELNKKKKQLALLIKSIFKKRFSISGMDRTIKQRVDEKRNRFSVRIV